MQDHHVETETNVEVNNFIRANSKNVNNYKVIHHRKSKP